MKKSRFAKATDELQDELRAVLKSVGYRAKGRTFNRVTKDGLTQVIRINLAPANPPAWTPIPGLRENYYGLFTIELGIYVPEVARSHMLIAAPMWVQDHHCCVRAGLSDRTGELPGSWWQAIADDGIRMEVKRLLTESGLPFLEKFSTRDKILHEWSNRSQNSHDGLVPRIVRAIILAERGEKLVARQLLNQQYLDAIGRHPGHAEFVKSLANRIGLSLLQPVK